MQTQANKEVEKGAAVYSRAVLAAYDPFVLWFSNTCAWNCPSRVLLEFYNQNVSGEHLEVGVGTGYFLDKCRFPTLSPKLTFVDLNPNCLRIAAGRTRRNHPGYEVSACHLANVLEPLSLGEGTFGSIGLNYVLHCLPGNMATKSAVFANLKSWLRPGGVLFGATILGLGVYHGLLARRLMSFYNARGIFGNAWDSAEGLRTALGEHFEESSVRVKGSVALFSAKLH